MDFSDSRPVEICILGPLVVRVGSDEVSIGGSVRRSILLRLALHRNQTLDASRLSEAIWGGERVSGAANRLQAQIALLRRTLGPERVLTDGSSYRLDQAGVAVDAELFEAEVAQGRTLLQAGEAHLAVDVLRSALARWRGPPLIDVAAYDWAAPVIALLTELNGLAHEALLESLLAVGLFGDVVVAAEQAIAEHPLRESLWRSSMLALAQAGRAAESARVFQR